MEFRPEMKVGGLAGRHVMCLRMGMGLNWKFWQDRMVPIVSLVVSFGVDVAFLTGWWANGLGVGGAAAVTQKSHEGAQEAPNSRDVPCKGHLEV